MIAGAIPNDGLSAYTLLANNQQRTMRAPAQTNPAQASQAIGLPAKQAGVEFHSRQTERTSGVMLYNAQGRVARPPGTTVATGSTQTDAPDESADASAGQSTTSDRTQQADKSAEDLSRPSKPNGDPVSDAELSQIRDLERIDAQVHVHEMSHSAVGGQYAGGASYGYTIGPDGKRYATSGEVGIDVSTIAGDPQATIRKMRQVSAAALAPAHPSAADRSIAARAQQQMMQARMDLAMTRLETSQTDPSAPEQADKAPQHPA